jgi:hypothetical protein
LDVTLLVQEREVRRTQSFILFIETLKVADPDRLMTRRLEYTLLRVPQQGTDKVQAQQPNSRPSFVRHLLRDKEPKQPMDYVLSHEQRQVTVLEHRQRQNLLFVRAQRQRQD